MRKEMTDATSSDTGRHADTSRLYWIGRVAFIGVPALLLLLALADLVVSPKLLERERQLAMHGIPSRRQEAERLYGRPDLVRARGTNSVLVYTRLVVPIENATLLELLLYYGGEINYYSSVWEVDAEGRSVPPYGCEMFGRDAQDPECAYRSYIGRYAEPQGLDGNNSIQRSAAPLPLAPLACPSDGVR